MIYVGIDVGKDGGIFAITNGKTVICKSGIPKIKGTTDVDYNALYVILYNIGKDNLFEDMVVGIEDVHSIFGASAKANFNFGHIKGIEEGMIVALGCSYHLIRPQVWQKGVWTNKDIVVKDDSFKRDPKATSLKTALRIFPHVDFRKSERSKKPHDGIVDAALIAEYCRITELE